MTSNQIDPLVEAIDDVLLSCGPQTKESLFDQLRTRGLAPTADEFEDAWRSDDLPLVSELSVFGPGVYVRLDPILVGRIFTHRLTSEEIATDTLRIDSDLEAAWWLTDAAPFDTVDGHAIDERLDETNVRAHLPPDTLTAFSHGDLIGVRVTPTGLRLEAVPSEVPAFPDDALDAVEAVSDGLVDEQEGVGSVELIHHLLLGHPDLLRHPTAPISESFADSLGLDLEAAYVRRLDDDLYEGDDIELDPVAEIQGIGRTFRLAPEDALAVFTFEAGADELLEPSTSGNVLEDPEVAAAVSRFLPALANPSVAVALFAHYVVGDDSLAPVLHDWASATLGSAPRAAKAHLWWLVGRTADQVNDVPGAEAAYENALDFDPHSYLALRELAARVAERGDARRAVSLLSRAGIGPEDTLFAMVSRYVEDDRRDLGRNDRCWCGSGQKYKRCHAGQTGFSLDQRVDWLYYKIALWVQDGAGVPLMTELARIRSEYRPAANAMEEAMIDPFVLDTAIFDGGYLASYLESRGQVLPDDEQMLATAWLNSQRSLYEIEDVRPGTGFTIRDLRTGDRHDVVERAGSRQLRATQLISVRLLSGGGPPVIHGGIEPVPDHQRDAVLATLDLQDSEAADPLRTMAILSGRFVPPSLRTVEGDPLVVCSSDLVVPSDVENAFADGLTRLYGDGGDEQIWTRTETAPTGQRILGSVRHDEEGESWMIDAQTERRFDALVAEVTALAPGIELESVTRTPLPTFPPPVQAAGRKRSTAGAVDSLDPETTAILEQFVAQREVSWVDEQIPALGGATPREATEDPTRRGELIRLLDSFEGYPSGPGTMNVDNLRRALGLVGE